MNCTNCGQLINPLRLKALPKVKTCVKCSSTSRVAGFPMITGKTTYSEIQIVEQDKAQELYNLQKRKGHNN